MIRRIHAVAKKELRQVRRDPLSLLMLLGLPMFLLVLYGFALNFDVRHVALAVQDHDASPASRDLVSAFVNSTYFDVTAWPAPGADLHDAVTARRVAKAVLVVPEGYGEDVAAGRDAPVQLLVDGADASTATTLLGYATAIVAEANLASVRRALLRAGRTDAPPGIEYRPRVWYNPELSSTRFLVPGLVGALLMLTAVLSTALSVVREKERGTMDQLAVAPIRTGELILGKTLPYLLISVAATVLILVAARVLFGVEIRGSIAALSLATLLYLVGALSFGLFISTVAQNQNMAFQMGLLSSILPAILLSGFIFQISSMPAPLRALTYAIPARYYIVILRGVILKGTGLAPYWDQMGWLLAFTVVSLGAASLRLARQGR